MTTSRRINRRTFLKATGAGAAALALSGEGRARASTARAPVELEFWGPSAAYPDGTITAEQIKAFNATVGKAQGIVVHNRVVSDSNASVKYSTAMTASSGSPDIVFTYQYWAVFSWAANGFIRPLDDLAPSMGITQDRLLPVSWDMIHSNGHIWGPLQNFDAYQFCWNPDIHQGAPPKTIAELDALAEKYTKFDSKGNLVQAGLVPWYNLFPDWVTLWGGSLYDTAKGKWTINTPANRKVLEWYGKYAHMLGGRDKLSGLTASLPDSINRNPFMAGKLAFQLAGEYWVGVTQTYRPKKLRYRFAHMPTAPGVPYGICTASGGNLFLIPTRSAHPKEAAVFIKYMMGTPNVMHFNNVVGAMPPNKDEYGIFVKALPYEQYYADSVLHYPVVPSIASPQLPLFNTLIGTAIDEVTFGRKTAAQAMATVDSKVSSAVQEFKATHPDWTAE